MQRAVFVDNPVERGYHTSTLCGLRNQESQGVFCSPPRAESLRLDVAIARFEWASLASQDRRGFRLVAGQPA